MQNRFNWNSVINLPKEDSAVVGQVINYYSRVEHYSKSAEATEFVQKYLSNAMAFNIDAEVLKFASDNVTIDGSFLEMGVCTGRTINFIAALNPRKTIYGFDSFAGLPENWERRDNIRVPQGTFAIKDKDFMPPVLRNVTLVKGLFNETLPDFQKDVLQKSPISFLHIDCDLYSSTNEVFRIFAENIIDGTIILFDELYNYPGYEQQEFRALSEFLESHEKKADYLAFNQNVGQVVVRITS